MMDLSRSGLVVALVLAFAGCGKKDNKEGTASSASAGGASGGSGGGNAAASAGGGSGGNAAKPAANAAGCKMPAEAIKANYVIPKGCDLKVDDDISLEEGGTLTIEAGAKLRFEPMKAIVLNHGKIVAKGTPEAPILFTSNNATKAPGDWQGIRFADRLTAGNVLDHVIVEYGGNNAGNMGGAIHIAGGTNLDKRIAITNSTFRNNKQSGLASENAEASFAAFTGNTFEKNDGKSMHLQAQTVGSIGANNKFAEPIYVEGQITTSQTWPAVGVPFVVAENIDVIGKSSATVLTLPEHATVKFLVGKGMTVGVDNGGGLVAKGVTFTTANATPGEGDWNGIYFTDKATQSVIENCTFEYAGRGDSKQGVLAFDKADKIVVKGTTFRHNKQPAMDGPNGDCGPSGKDASNKSEGQPTCNKE